MLGLTCDSCRAVRPKGGCSLVPKNDANKPCSGPQPARYSLQWHLEEYRAKRNGEATSDCMGSILPAGVGKPNNGRRPAFSPIQRSSVPEAGSSLHSQRASRAAPTASDRCTRSSTRRSASKRSHRRPIPISEVTNDMHSSDVMCVEVLVPVPRRRKASDDRQRAPPRPSHLAAEQMHSSLYLDLTNNSILRQLEQESRVDSAAELSTTELESSLRKWVAGAMDAIDQAAAERFYRTSDPALLALDERWRKHLKASVEPILVEILKAHRERQLLIPRLRRMSDEKQSR
ncbi:hypothetical protein EIP91_007805 [Steccherinum ochraceum]|uniref:Uncharacterized protein n=1 Tax=Steccherinum ochraceum TaxID=92696 RepID=A0A4V6N718_9APHY|nr:hypothetical protein EIP91_007805 [Steccherinum ochraceum]